MLRDPAPKPAHRHGRPVPALACAIALLFPAGARADAFAASDLLHVIDADGRSHLLQHTLAAEGVELALRLPGSVIPGRVLFVGPDRARRAARHARRPDRVSIGSGAAVVRYRHQFGEEVEAVEGAGDGTLRLVARSVPEALRVDPGADREVPAFEAVSTWAFPAEVEVRAWRVQDASGAASAEPDGADDTGDTDAADVADDAAGSPGRWSFEDNVLTWSQTGLAAVTLEIEYRLSDDGADPADGPTRADEPAGESTDAAGAPAVADAAASIDTDADGVPDVRDVCPGDAPDDAPGGEPTDGPDRPGVDELGCRAGTPLVLGSVGFVTGRTRLDLSARRALDRLAAALAASEGDWEIAAHTDGVGPEARNLALSLRRAESVRHYLMLRGVEPNRVVARGYGEAEPVADDATAAGRAANRRVELRRVDPRDGLATEGVGENPPDGDG